MYSVSSDYIAALRAKVRNDSVSGDITLSGGAQINVNDENLVSSSLKLSKELCGSQYRIGSFNLACLRFSFFYDNALGIDLTGATVCLTYSLEVRAGVQETVPLGTFLIDPVLSVRRKNVLNVVAYDAGVLADREPSATLRNITGTPADIILAVCTECGIATDMTAADFGGFPNNALTVTPKDKQIQSCRDIIMWCAALLCGYAVIDRSSKLVVIPAKYSVSQQDSSAIICSREVTASERQSIYVTDTRAYIKYLTAYRGDDVVNYTSSYVSPDDQASPAAYVLEKNPLLCDSPDSVCDAANNAWLQYIDSFKQRGIQAVLIGDPAIDVGDTLMFRGGDVDQRSGIVGVVTSYEWAYRNYHTVVCSAAECVGSLASGAVSARTRAQTAKRIDAVDTSGGGSGGGMGRWLNTSKTSIAFNDLYNDPDFPLQHSSDSEYDFIEGYNNHHYVSRPYSMSHMEGMGNTLYRGERMHVGGVGNTVGNSVTPNSTHQNSIVSGNGNNIPGVIQDSIVTGNGNRVLADIMRGMVGGYQNIVEDIQETIVWGEYNTGEDARRSVVTGTRNNFTDLVDELIVGSENTVDNCQQGAVFGYHNNVDSSNKTIVCGIGNTVNSTESAIICGNGASNTSGKYIVAGQVFYVTSSGNVAAAGSYGTIGADYAEMFEWADGNRENADRRGMLVALAGDRIVPANGNGFIGVVSAVPSVVGNSAGLYWAGRYIKDVFGAVMTDENGEPLTSPDYDPDREYIPRSERREWAAVGMVGRLTAVDDGSCTVGGYVTAKDGIAKKSGTYTRARMLRRIDGTHIEVLVK